MNALKNGILGLGICLFCSSIIIGQGGELPSTPPLPLSPPQEETPSIFVVVEEMPYPESCEGNIDLNLCRDQTMIDFIYSNITYPTIAREASIEGIAVVSFVIDKEGSIIDVEIMRDPGGGCGAEAVRVVELMGEEMTWVSGKQRGQNVPVRMNLPIRFKLDPDPIQTADDYMLYPDQPARYPNARTQSDAQDLWRAFVEENMEYPEEALKAKEEGTVTVWFIVDEFGIMTDFKVIYSSSQSLEAEALRLVEKLGENEYWTAAQHEGELVRTPMALDIDFDRKEWKRNQKNKK